MKCYRHDTGIYSEGTQLGKDAGGAGPGTGTLFRGLAEGSGRPRACRGGDRAGAAAQPHTRMRKRCERVCLYIHVGTTHSRHVCNTQTRSTPASARVTSAGGQSAGAVTELDGACWARQGQVCAGLAEPEGGRLVDMESMTQGLSAARERRCQLPVGKAVGLEPGAGLGRDGRSWSLTSREGEANRMC